jgi:hypothetical protein
MDWWNDNMNPLADKDFLRELDQNREREVFAKIVSLDYNENPIEEITGRVSSGTVSIDGSSSVRRSCSLGLIAQELNIHDFYWGLTTKFKLYSGLKNNINPKYPDIIWFPLGMFVISSFNTSQDTNSYTVSIQGKDKMCLLNGTLGGTVMSLTADFGTETIEDESGESYKQDLSIKNIIREVVHEYAREPYHNIIINDLDTYGLELMEYRGSSPMYILINQADEAVNIRMDLSMDNMYLGKYEDGRYVWSIKPGVFLDKPEVMIDGYSLVTVYDTRLESLDVEQHPDRISIFYGGKDNGGNDSYYTIMKAEYGSSVGYKVTELTYSGDLIAQVGSPVTTAVLDKIVSMLGDFEYFYDLQGRFIFQRKKTYINTSWNNIRSDSENKQVYVESAAYTSEVTYSFENSSLITSFQNSPDFDNLRNDYSIWGTKTTVSGNETPVHLRYALDKKPIRYINYEGDIYSTNEDNELFIGQIHCDWRELIYQMASDYMKHNKDDDFTIQVGKNNPDYYPDGYTGYEVYYTDIYSFWRELYNPDYESTYSICYVTKSNYEQAVKDKKIEYYWYDQCNDKTAYIPENDYFYKDAYGIFQKVHSMTAEKLKNNSSYYYTLIKCDETMPYVNNRDYYTKSEGDYVTLKNYKDLGTSINNIGWNINVIKLPQQLNFWFDFLDTEGELGQYSVRNIGTRPKAENDSDVKAIYFRDIPTILFFGIEDTKAQLKRDLKINYVNYGLTKPQVEAMSDKQLEDYIIENNLISKLIAKQKDEIPGYAFIQLPDYLENLFTISTQGKCAKDSLDSWLYNYTYCTETVSLTSIPIYYLEPNTRVYIHDNNSGIDGEYIVDRISLPLQYSGTMNISATKAAERIY